MTNKIQRLLRDHSYSIFLGALAIWVGLLPIFEFTGLIDLIEFLIVLFVILSAYHFLSKTRMKKYTTALVALCLLTVVWANISNENIWVMNAARMLFFLLLLFTTTHFFYRIRHAKQVDSELLVISLATYILLGVMGAILCYITTVLYPHAYNASFDPNSPILDFTYYSFVTMTTLGYGDITPQIPASKSLAVLISLTGQLYVAVVIAMIVGKYISGDIEKD